MQERDLNGEVGSIAQNKAGTGRVTRSMNIILCGVHTCPTGVSNTIETQLISH